MNKNYIYHSPDGDRIVFLMGKNENGTVDLAKADGSLSIGNCTIGKAIGQCSEVLGEIIDIEVSTSEEAEIPELTKDQLKELLDEAGVVYDARLGKEKLKELLESIN